MGGSKPAVNGLLNSQFQRWPVPRDERLNRPAAPTEGDIAALFRTATPDFGIVAAAAGLGRGCANDDRASVFHCLGSQG